MRHETAIRRLRTIAERCQQASPLWGDGAVMLAAYAFGDVLDRRTDMPAVQVAFVLDLPADELTWGCAPPSCAGLPSLLEIDKAPVDWYWRPSVWPVSNHVIRRPLRIWSVEGPDEVALDALARGDAEGRRLPPADPAQEADQLAKELEACLAHLRRVESDFWEQAWRSAHRGFGVYPEYHLWAAVHGYLDLLAAVRPAVNGMAT